MALWPSGWDAGLSIGMAVDDAAELLTSPLAAAASARAGSRWVGPLGAELSLPSEVDLLPLRFDVSFSILQSGPHPGDAEPVAWGRTPSLGRVSPLRKGAVSGTSPSGESPEAGAGLGPVRFSVSSMFSTVGCGSSMQVLLERFLLSHIVHATPHMTARTPIVDPAVEKK
jgi:hypothetical protein